MPIFGQKTSILSKLHYIMEQKSQWDTLLFQFSWKNQCSHAHILSKIVFKSKLLSCPYFVKNTSILTKPEYSHVSFLKSVMKNLELSCPYLVKKRQFYQNCTKLRATKSTGWLFLRLLKKKQCYNAHILSGTRLFSKNTRSNAYILLKNVDSPKNGAHV